MAENKKNGPVALEEEDDIDISGGLVPHSHPTHPAGRVTAIDEETRLPIVRRSKIGAGDNDVYIPDQSPARSVDRTGIQVRPEPNQGSDIQQHSAEGREVLQSTDSASELHASASDHADWLEQKLAEVVQGIEGAKVEAVRDQKAKSDLNDKIKREGQAPETIPDYLAGRIVVETHEARDQVAERMRSVFTVIREKDDFKNGSDPYGFRTHTFQVQTPDGNSAEVQVVPKEISEVNDKTHPDYEKAEDHRLNGSDLAHEKIAAKVKGVHDAAMQEFEARQEPKHKFGNTQHVISTSSEAGAALDAVRGKIADEDAAGDGKDVGGNHVTVRYGIQDDKTDGIESFIRKQAPFEATLGPTSHFPPSEHSDGAAPLIAPVHAPDLHRMHKEIEKHGSFTEPNFPEYKPHATIAYLKPESVSKYSGDKTTDGKKFRVDTISISDRNGNLKHIPMQGIGKGSRVQLPDGRRGVVQFYDGKITKKARVLTDDGETVQSIGADKLKPEEEKSEGWIGVDLDGSLAHYKSFEGKDRIGMPIPRMVDRVKKWLANGEDVRIFTARIHDDKDGVAHKAIEAWCRKHIGQVLPITNIKDPKMKTLWDDRAVQLERNHGEILGSARKARGEG